MDREAARPRQFNRLRMDGPGIAIEHQIGDALVIEDLGESCRPILGLTEEGQIAAPFAPERLIPGIEAHAPDIRPRPAQHLPELIEERPVRPLEKQERTVLAGQTSHGRVSCLCA